MNQEKKTSRQNASAGEYITPEIIMVEVKAGKVFCRSNQDTTYGGYTCGEEDGN